MPPECRPHRVSGSGTFFYRGRAGRFAIMASAIEAMLSLPQKAAHPRVQKPWTRRQLLALGGLATGLLTGCTNPARDARTLKIGAMQPGTSWYVFGVALANLLAPELPGMTVEVVPRGGGVGNPIAVSRGAASLAIAQAATAAWAYDGEPIAFHGEAHPRLRALMGGMNSVWLSAMLHEDYIRRTGNDTLEKALLGSPAPRIVVKPAGSAIPVLMDILLTTLGASRDGIRERGGSVMQVGASQIAALMRDGFADLYFEGAIRGHPTITEITSTVDVRFVEIPEAALQRIVRPGVNQGLLPKWYPKQKAAMRSVDMGTVLICRDDLPEQLAWLVTKIVCESKDQIVKAHKAWLDFVPENAGRIENTGIPLHPGAARFYQERGWA